MKCFIIRMKGNLISEDLAIDLANSLESQNINYDFFDAIYGDAVEKEFSKKELSLYYKQNNNRKSQGVKGCFLSHYSLWENCIKNNENFLIFEHDALLIRPLQDFGNDFDVLNLDYASRVEEDYNHHLSLDKGDKILSWPVAPQKKGFISQIAKSSIKGLHAYIITPNGAKKLIQKAKDIGTVPADVHVNSMYIDLKYTQTSYARINPKYWIDAKYGSINSFTRL